jgi:hypothetical protein
MQIDRNAGRALLLTLLVLAALALAGAPILLHFTQKAHARLPLDVLAQFPPDGPPTRGEAFATIAAVLIEHELQSPTGWRPNDVLLWGPRVAADNNANRQLGIIQALRESVRVLKDHLTKVSSDEYDQNLVAAETAFRNDPLKLWLPSAESKFSEGAQRLRDYVAGLGATPPRSRPLNGRNTELIRLFHVWTDLLGDAHAQLYRPDVGLLRTDDVFYHSQGVAHVMYHLTRAVMREYRREVEAKPVIGTLLDEIADALGHAAVIKPLIVLDGGPSGIFANHRRNLDAYVTEARQKMISLREELEK